MIPESVVAVIIEILPLGRNKPDLVIVAQSLLGYVANSTHIANGISRLMLHAHTPRLIASCCTPRIRYAPNKTPEGAGRFDPSGAFIINHPAQSRRVTSQSGRRLNP